VLGLNFIGTSDHSIFKTTISEHFACFDDPVADELYLINSNYM